MINYNRLGYEIKRDFTNFSLKLSKGLKRPQEKFIHQMIYGILAGNKLHLSEMHLQVQYSFSLTPNFNWRSKIHTLFHVNITVHLLILHIE